MVYLTTFSKVSGYTVSNGVYLVCEKLERIWEKTFVKKDSKIMDQYSYEHNIGM